MRRPTRTPQIPLPDREKVVDAVLAIKEVVEVREGRRGDPMDKAVTFRDLESLQLVQRQEDAQWQIVQGTNGLPVVVPPWVNPVPWSGDSYDPNTDFSTPPEPRNLIVSGGYSSINLSWVYPSYRNHGYTEVWRSAVNDLSTAALVGVNQATVYNDPVGTERGYYYWVRNVSKADVKSEFNSLVGTYGETAEDVSRKIDQLQTEVLGDSLTQTLSERIYALEVEQGSISATLSTLTDTQAQKTEVLANTVSGNTTSIQVQQSITEGLKGQYTVKIDNNGFVSGFGLAAEIVSGVPRSSFSVLADRFAIINPNVRKFTISSVSVATTSVVSISTLTRSGTTATAVTATSHGLAVGDRFRLTADLGGWTGNYKVATTPNSTTFTFVVDSTLGTPATGAKSFQKFYTATVNTAFDHGLAVGEAFVITGMSGDLKWNGTWSAATVPTTTSLTFALPPNYSTTPMVDATTSLGRGAVPFIVEDGKVYIDTALIRDATITTAKIESLTADKITTGNLTATLNVTTGTVKSSTSFGQAGFYLGADGGTQKFYVGDGSNKYLSWDGSNLSVRGTVYADAGSFTGSIYAGAGTIGGITIQSNNLRSSNYVANTSGWQITSAGAAEFNSITARGVTIYNNSGAVILSSGSGIPSSAVTGLGAFAGLSQITAANISTYIASAAIGTAYIADAAISTAKINDAAITTAKIGDAAIVSAKIGSAEVGTLKIAGNAVTIPLGNTATSFSSYIGASVTGTFIASQQVAITASVGGNAGAFNPSFSIWRDSTKLFEVMSPYTTIGSAEGASFYIPSVSMTVMDTPPSDGSYTYTVQVDVGGTYGAKSSITVIQCKR